MELKSGDFPHAENYYIKAISLPIYPSMTKKMQEKIVKRLQMRLEL